MSRRSWADATLLVVAAVLAGACVRPDDPGVAVTKVQANIVFGVKPPPEPVAPALPEEASVLTEAPPEPVPLAFPPLAFQPAPLPRPGARRAGGDCPPALATAVADKPAEISVSGQPEVGLYRWKREGSVTGFERRILRNVKTEADGVVTFETVQPTVGRETVTVKAFRVKPRPVNESANAGSAPVGPRVGEPDRGVSLVSSRELDANGNAVATFEPVTPLLLLPLPVQQGEKYQSVAVDRRSGQTMVLDVTVQRRQRIDACGDLVDGWLVDGTLTDTAREGGAVETGYVVATQLGGMLVHERYRAAEGEAPVDLSFTLAQLRPDPAPAGS